MGTKYKTVGGGAATGLGQDWTQFLQGGLNQGTFGSGGVGSTMGIAGVLNDILSGGAGKLGGSLAELFKTQQTSDINGLRSRFGVGGGTGFGTPGAFAEGNYRAKAAPEITSAIGNLQLGALSQLFPQIGALAQKGIPQAQTVGQQNPWLQAAQIGIPLISAAISGGAGGGIGAAGNLTPSSPMGLAPPNSFNAGDPFAAGTPMPGLGSYNPFQMPSMDGPSAGLSNAPNFHFHF